MTRVFHLIDNRGDTKQVEAENKGREWKALCPYHDDHVPSLSIDEAKGVYFCFSCHAKGKITNNHDNVVQLCKKKIVAVYPYEDENNKLLYEVIRYEPKGFAFRRPDGNKKWLYNLHGVRRVPYRLPDLLASTVMVFVVEGEKDCETLRDHGLTATTNAGGAGKWQNEFSDYLAGRDTVLLPDSDKPGKDHMNAIAKTLIDKAASTKIVELPGLSVKEDISDWFRRYHHTADELIEVVDKTPEYEFTPGTGTPNHPCIVLMKGFYPRPFTEEIISRYKFFATGTTERDDLFRYSKKEGLWKRDAVDLIAFDFRTGSTLDDQHKKTEVIKQIEMDVRGLVWQQGKRNLPEPNLELIPCDNGVFDLQSGTVRPFTAEDYFTWKLPWSHDNNPSGSREFVDLIESLLPPEKISDLWELMAYSLWRDYSYQKFFFLFGRGSNGKTLFQHLLVNLIGKGNASSFSLDEIQQNRFAAASLQGKLLNISGEVNYHDLEDTRLLKQLTGGDLMTADRKYLNPIQFRNYSKMVFLTNQIPKSHDTTDGFYRRAYLIEFPKQFDENPSLMQIVNDLQNKQSQYERLFCEVVNHLRALKKNNFIFSNHRSPDSMKKEYESLSNPLTQFVETYCQKKPDGVISKRDFKERFNSWLKEHGFNAYTDTRLGLEMKELGFEERRREIWCWLGIGWKP